MRVSAVANETETILLRRIFITGLNMKTWVALTLALLLTNFNDVAAKESFVVSYRDHRGAHDVKVERKNDFYYEFKVGEKHLELATLDWSPYISSQACEHGWVFQSAVALLHSIGYGASIRFYPWVRSVSQVESGKADILFPEYFIEPEAPSDIFTGTRRLDHLYLSKSFGWGPIAFMSRADFSAQVYKGDFKNLVNEHIGVVRGYQNTPEFDRLMDKGEFSIVTAKSDLHNVDLLKNNRVNMIIGDPEVIVSEIKQSGRDEAEIKRLLANIKVVDPIIQMNALFFAISKRAAKSDELLVELNQAIEQFKEYGIIDEIRYRINKTCQ